MQALALEPRQHTMKIILESNSGKCATPEAEAPSVEIIGENDKDQRGGLEPNHYPHARASPNPPHEPTRIP